MGKKLIYKDISPVLIDVAKVTDLNTITLNTVVKDIFPDYNDKKMLNWGIGLFLNNSKHGLNVRYYKLLDKLGFKFYNSGLIAQVNQICDCIDKISSGGVDLNTIPSDATIKDYIDNCNPDISDFNLGVAVYNAQYRIGSNAIQSKLTECGLQRKYKPEDRIEEVKKILVELSKVTDLNTISVKSTVKDFLPNYDKAWQDYRIGVFIQNARAGQYEKMNDLLSDLGFTFEKTKQKTPTKKICSIIDQLVEKGVDLEDIEVDKRVKDLIPNHEDGDFEIGSLLKKAKAERTGAQVRSKLREHGFDLTPDFMSADIRKELLTQVAKTHNLNRISTSDKLIDVLPECEERYANWEIGKFLKNTRSSQNVKYKQFLSDLGFTFQKKSRRHDLDFIITAINDLCDVGIDLNKVKERQRMSHFLDKYKEDDYHIGALLNNARMKKVPSEICEELGKHDFDFNIRVVHIPCETKLDVIKNLCSKNVDINCIVSTDRLSNFVKLEEGQQDYCVGKWIRNAEMENNQLFKELIKLGYIPRGYGKTKRITEFSK